MTSAQPQQAQFAPTEPASLEPASLQPAFDVSSVFPEDFGGDLIRSTVATFLYARLHHFGAACETMSGSELTSFVNEVRHILSDAVLKLGGEIAQRRPDSILAVFSNGSQARKPDHAQRGLHAAILTVHETVQLAHRIAARPESARIPSLRLAVGVHLGVGDVTPRTHGAPGMVHAVGEAVEIARLLEVTAADLHWSVAASSPARLAAAGRVEPGRIGSLGLPDDTFIDVVEITGLLPRKGSKTPPALFQTLREAIAQNQQLSRSGSGGASKTAPQCASHLVIEGYKLLRKIGEGGMASVFLAQPAGGGDSQVLKVLRLDTAAQMEGLQRFMQEFALLAQVNHPNVARIYRQDFSQGNAYIAMEYFPLGDLRRRMVSSFDAVTAVRYIKQIAAGLDAIHRVGIVHRDLKPDNLMLRHDGNLVIADFGIAKHVSMLITDTGAGDIVGTPYYLSPEQAVGQPVDARCDLYSLGVLAYEMLVGEKPYHGRTAQELLNLHVNGTMPRLPAPQQHLQPILDKMVAKNRDQRYESAQALLDALELLEQ
jgi:serine/threonine-protein kinase PpkA